MLKKLMVYWVLFAAFFSCTSDKINLSPFTGSLVSSSGTSIVKPVNIQASSLNAISYSSEITNLISSAPKFEDKNVTKAMSSMKLDLEEYIYAVEAKNTAGEKRAMQKFEKSYQKLQKLKAGLKPYEQASLNRYLVEIKTNVSLLESAFPRTQ